MSSAVLITRLCPRWSLPHICGDVPVPVPHHCGAGLKPRGHIESQNPRAEIPPPYMHGDFFIHGYMVLFSIVFLLCVKNTLGSRYGERRQLISLSSPMVLEIHRIINRS